MATHTRRPDSNQVYFCTFTCYNWLPLFEWTDFYSSIYNWFEIVEKYGNSITGYVIMPNHLHFLVHVSDNSPVLNTLVGNGKRFMAYEIVEKLKNKGENAILDQLMKGVAPNEKSKGKIHQVFQPSFDAKPCYKEKFLLQKLHYMHYNPVAGKWKLVEDYVLYKHSSAQFYELGEQGLFPVTHYREFI